MENTKSRYVVLFVLATVVGFTAGMAFLNPVMQQNAQTGFEDGSASSAGETDCSDGIDNDNDGLTDCQDNDCDYSPSCAEDCANGKDDDNDGTVDCDDAWCEEDPACK